MTDPNLEQSIAAHSSFVRSRIQRKVGGTTDVDDLVQETLTRALGAIESLRDPDVLRPWLLTIAERTAVDAVRAKTRQRPPEALPDDVPDPAAGLRELEFWNVVSTRLADMTEDVREAGRRFFMLGESLAEIGRALGRSKSTVQSQVERVRKALETRLTECGYAALLPALEITQRIEAAPSPTLPTGAGSTRYAWLGALGLVVASVAITVMASSSEPTPPAVGTLDESAIAKTAASRSASDIDASDEVDGRQAPRRNATASPMIHGRVVDATDGAPIAGARVFAYDYVYFAEHTAITDARGEFRLEKTSGYRRPLEVYVDPPDGNRFARVNLNAVVPKTSPREVTMREAITVSLSAHFESNAERYLRDVDVAVLDLTTQHNPSPGLDWPPGEGWWIRQLLPPSYSIVARRHVTGDVKDVSIDGLPRTPLGFVFVDEVGRIWFGYTQVTKPQPEEPTDGRAMVRVSLQLSEDTPASTRRSTPRWNARRALYTHSDPADLFAEPNNADRWAGICNALFGAIDRRAEAEESALEVHGVYVLAGDWREDTTLGGTAADVRVDVRRAMGRSARRTPSVLAVSLRRLDSAYTLVGYRAATDRDILDFETVPTGEPLLLEVFDPSFTRVLHRSRFQVPHSTDGVFDIFAATRAVEVDTQIGNRPLPSCAIRLVARERESAARQVDRTHPIEAESDRTGHARIEVGSLDAYDILVSAHLAGSKVALAEAGHSGDGDVPSRHGFDLGAGFDLRLRDGATPLELGEDELLYVEGEVSSGGRRVSFRHRFASCPDGKVSVRPGIAGDVQARAYRRLPGDDDADWPCVEHVAFRIHSSESNRPHASADVVIPARFDRLTETATLALRCRTADGAPVRLDDESADRLAVAVRASWPTDRRALDDDPPYWTELAWRLADDGSILVEGPAAMMPGTEFRALLRDHAPVYGTVPAPDAGGRHAIDLRFQRGREVSLARSTWELDVDYFSGGVVGRQLRNHDVLLSVGNRQVFCESEVLEALENADTDSPLVLSIRRDGRVERVTLYPPWRDFMSGVAWLTR